MSNSMAKFYRSNSRRRGRSFADLVNGVWSDLSFEETTPYAMSVKELKISWQSWAKLSKLLDKEVMAALPSYARVNQNSSQMEDRFYKTNRAFTKTQGMA